MPDISFVFFFKQKTAYEMRISDWSSDVCSSDLVDHHRAVLERVGKLVGKRFASEIGWCAEIRCRGANLERGKRRCGEGEGGGNNQGDVLQACAHGGAPGSAIKRFPIAYAHSPMAESGAACAFTRTGKIGRAHV